MSRKLFLQKYMPQGSAIRLFVLIGLIWAAIAAPFSVVIILAHYGATPPQLGIFTASTAAISVVFQPIWGLISDKIRSPRKVLCMCLTGSAIFFGLVLFTESLYIAAALLFVEAIFRCSIIALSDSHILSEIKTIPGLQYSYIRVGGSVFFGLMSLLCSFVINAHGVTAIIPISVIVAFSAIMWGLFIAKGRWEKTELDGGYRAKSNLKKDAISLLKNKSYILFISFCAFSAMATMPVFIFNIEFVGAVGGKPGDVPMISFMRTLVEIPLFIAVGVMGTRLNTKNLLSLGVGLTFIFVAGLAFATNMPSLTAFHMIGSGGFILALTGRMQYLRKYAPESVLSTSITIMAACEVGLGSVVGNLLAGVIIGRFGTHNFAFVSLGFLTIAVILQCFVRRSITKLEKKNAQA